VTPVFVLQVRAVRAPFCHIAHDRAWRHVRAGAGSGARAKGARRPSRCLRECSISTVFRSRPCGLAEGAARHPRRSPACPWARVEVDPLVSAPFVFLRGKDRWKRAELKPRLRARSLPGRAQKTPVKASAIGGIVRAGLRGRHSARPELRPGFTNAADCHRTSFT